MEIKNYTLSELADYIRTGDYLNDKTVPITPLRVYSQQKNPKASNSDIVFSIAFDNNGVIIGYIGALPELINGERCAWNSCWWVKPGASANVSMALFVAFLNNWDRKVLFSDMTPLTASIIKRLGFCTHKKTIGFRAYYRFILADVLPRKKTYFKKIKGLLSLLDASLNSLLSIRNVFLPKFKYGDVLLEKAEKLNADDDVFIQQLNQNQAAKRSSADFNWIAQNPWLLATNIANEQIRKGYYFSYAVDDFRSMWIRFVKNGKLVALVNYTIKDSELKLPYVFCESGADNFVAKYSLYLLKSNRNLASITVFHQGIVQVLNQQKGFIFKVALPKYSAISNELLQKIGKSNIELQMGDGDCVFT